MSSQVSLHPFAALIVAGRTDSEIHAQVRARRWQRVGRAVILHNGERSRSELCRAALLNCGPRAALTAFTAAEELGLSSWERDEIHVLVPGGTHVPRLPGIPTRVHYVGWRRPAEVVTIRNLHRAAPALVVAASTFRTPRPACGILAAGYSNGSSPRRGCATHCWPARESVTARRCCSPLRTSRRAPTRSARSIQARLCRRWRLPRPTRQVLRVDRSGRRRDVDAEWTASTGRRVIAEVDGALHLASRPGWADQLRQNEFTLGGDLVLRFPSVVVRHEPALVADQLVRALRL